MKDKIIRQLINEERKRQNNSLELIASENYCSKEVRYANGSILTYKYAEGYPNKRYYGGCKYIDQIQQIAQTRARILFNVKYANVQPHSGSQANAAAYKAIELYLKDNKKINNRKLHILSLSLDEGGHLTHGSLANFSGNLYHFDYYKLNSKGEIDLELIKKAIIKYKPDVLLAGYTAYPYFVSFKELKNLAIEFDCLFMVDMAHIAGFVAAELCENPCLYADIVTSTTHKTLRGPRGGIILSNNEKLAKFVDKAVFPYYQGGPLEHTIAAKAICFSEAMSYKFKKYLTQTIRNTMECANVFQVLGDSCTWTTTHLLLLNVKKSFGLTGRLAQSRLEMINITTNKNMIQNDTESPVTTSGLRIGFAALTTRGCTQDMSHKIAKIIHTVLSYNDEDFKRLIPHYIKEVKKITKKLKRV